MHYLYKTIKAWLLLIVTSFGIWVVLYQLSGLWAKDASLAGYHSYSSDTAYLSLRALVIIVLIAKLVQALVIAKVSYTKRKASYITIGVVDNLLWLTIFVNQYGIKADGSFNVSIGYGYLLMFGLLSNIGLILGLFSGNLIQNRKKSK